MQKFTNSPRNCGKSLRHLRNVNVLTTLGTFWEKLFLNMFLKSKVARSRVAFNNCLVYGIIKVYMIQTRPGSGGYSLRSKHCSAKLEKITKCPNRTCIIITRVIKRITIIITNTKHFLHNIRLFVTTWH